MAQINGRVDHRWVLEIIGTALHQQNLQIWVRLRKSTSSHTSSSSTAREDDVDVADGLVVGRHVAIGASELLDYPWQRGTSQLRDERIPEVYDAQQTTV